MRKAQWMVVVAFAGLAMFSVAGFAQEAMYKAGGDAYNAAQKLYSERKYAEAGKAYEDFIRAYPGHPSRDTAFYMASVCYRNAKQPDDVVRIVAQQEKDMQRSGYLLITTRNAADICYSEKQYKKAAEFYTKLAGDLYYADRYTVFNQLVNCYYAEKEYDKALAACDRFLTDYSGPAGRKVDMLLRKMDCLGYMERFADYEAVAKEAEKIAPNSVYVAMAWEKVANAEQRSKRWQNAYDAYVRAAGVPGYVNADGCMRAACYVWRNVRPVDNARVAEACEQFTKSFQDSAYDGEMRLALAAAYAALKDTNNELRARREFDGLYGKCATGADNLMGIVNMAARDKAVIGEGVTAAQRIVDEFPNSPQAEQALYWLAESSPKGADAAAKTAYLERLVRQFPCGSYAERSAKRLEQLRK